MKTTVLSTAGPWQVKVGSVVVPIYYRASRNCYLVVDMSTGKRRLVQCADLDTAKTEAGRIATLIATGEREAASFVLPERDEFSRARSFLKPHGLDVDKACLLLSQLIEVAGVDRLMLAAQEYARRHPVGQESVTVAVAADAFRSSKEAKGRSDRTSDYLKSVLDRLIRDFPDRIVSTFRTKELQNWIDKLKIIRPNDKRFGKLVSPQTRVAYRTVCSGFFAYCKRQEWITDNPMDSVEVERARNTDEIRFWSPAEASALLSHADESIIPALAISLFSGIRTAELCRLTWAQVSHDHIEVGKKMAKTKSRRLVPITSNLRLWLAEFRKDAKDSDPIFSGHWTGYPKLVSAACKKANIPRVHNGGRHSFISYRLALVKNDAQVAMEAGTSTAMIYQHYRALTDEKTAAAYFAIVPKASNVVPFAAAQK